MKLNIVGAGPGSEEHLTIRGRRAISDADLVIATPRLYENFAHLNGNTACRPFSELVRAVREAEGSCRTVTVLVSGDCGFFSGARNLCRELEGMDLERISGISSLQYLSAKIGLDHDDMKIASFHGRSGRIVPLVCYHPKIFVLAGEEEQAHAMIRQLVEAGLGEARVTVGENLSSRAERILTGSAGQLREERFAGLAALIVQNPHWTDPCEPIPDSAFIRRSVDSPSRVPMTKQAVRRLCLAALDVRPADCVADIGAGTGSVSVEMARKACEGVVFALEKNAAAVELVKENIARFRAFNVTALHGEAPDGLDALPPPDKAFIGGSGGNLAGIIAGLMERNPRVRIVVSAVTLETLHEAVGELAARGCSPDVLCANVALAGLRGRYRMMRAENPVYIISGQRNAD